jgi:hypothetical protein
MHSEMASKKVAQDGRRSIIAAARQGSLGATGAMFNTTNADRDTLYAVTDGGAFTDGPKTRGALVAFTPYAAQ